MPAVIVAGAGAGAAAVGAVLGALDAAGAGAFPPGPFAGATPAEGLAGAAAGALHAASASASAHPSPRAGATEPRRFTSAMGRLLGSHCAGRAAFIASMRRSETNDGPTGEGCSRRGAAAGGGHRGSLPASSSTRPSAAATRGNGAFAPNG